MVLVYFMCGKRTHTNTRTRKKWVLLLISMFVCWCCATMARLEGGIKSKLYSFNINRNWYCTVSLSLCVCLVFVFELSQHLNWIFIRIFSWFLFFILLIFLLFFFVVIQKQIIDFIIVILHHINIFCTYTHTRTYFVPFFIQ